jgi:hypothetical protein
MVQHQANFAQLTDLDPVLTDIFYQHFTQHDDALMDLFGLRTSTKAKETDLRIGGFSDPVNFDLTGEVVYDAADAGYEIEYSHTHWVRGFSITQVMLEDMQYDSIFDSADNLGLAFDRKRRKDRASVFNNAFSGSYLGYDSKALCASDHPRSKTDSTAVDNALALALNSTNLETAITTHMALGDDLGEEINIRPNLLVVPRALRKTAYELVMSEYDPESAENARNIHASEMQFVVSPYLSNTDAWFTVDTMMANKYLKWYDRIMPTFNATDTFDTLLRKYAGRMRYSYGWSDFRWILGSSPTLG